ncbi:DNA polymerase alpha/epsilon subunit B-domain-containing protein [Abortiporus biennis]|nr:DNA polymerase alpha/epsilon subunit B-domain-containing protein [Abortiporus biennis]
MTETETLVPETPYTRPSTSVLPPSEKTPSFTINAANKSYRHQYANIYFVRLRLLRTFVEDQARKRWREVAGNPTYVPRVLEVEKGELCFVIGTVYMDMPLKPNVIEDIARDHSIPSPPPRQKFYSEEDNIMLEDESGRICLVGDRIRSAGLVTGVIVGALGIETHNGDFEVVDFCYAGMPPQPSTASAASEADESMDVDSPDEWVALVSGLEVGDLSPSDAQIQMLAEYLTCELGGTEDQTFASRISRLIIAGNSLSSIVSTTAHEETERKPRRYGYDNTTFTPHPALNLSTTLLDLARSMPIHLLPGASDPSGTILPQQSLPRGMFGQAVSYSTFSCETNPTYIHIGNSNPSQPSVSNKKPQQKASSLSTKSKSSSTTKSLDRTILVNSGQPLNDMFKYLPTPPHTRLSIAESTLKWRHMAPTAPDTLWCHPFFTSDPFVISETPDIYVIGNQPEFKTRLVREKSSSSNVNAKEKEKEEGEKRCRIVLVPSFKETGVVALVNLRTLEVKTMCFSVQGMNGG